MDTSLRQSIAKLARGEILRVDRALGQSIAVVRGMVWITQEGDRRDTFLSDGDSFVFQSARNSTGASRHRTNCLRSSVTASEVIERPVSVSDAGGTGLFGSHPASSDLAGRRD